MTETACWYLLIDMEPTLLQVPSSALNSRMSSRVPSPVSPPALCYIITRIVLVTTQIMSSHQGITVCTCYHHFIVQCGATQHVPVVGETSGVAPGGGGGEQTFSAV